MWMRECCSHASVWFIAGFSVITLAHHFYFLAHDFHIQYKESHFAAVALIYFIITLSSVCVCVCVLGGGWLSVCVMYYNWRSLSRSICLAACMICLIRWMSPLIRICHTGFVLSLSFLSFLFLSLFLPRFNPKHTHKIYIGNDSLSWSI